jgi:histidyl-tRNA synthetase
MTTFIRSPQIQGGGFQQGWNMIMNLYGKKQIDEKIEQQGKMHEAQISQMQKAQQLREGTFKAEQDIMKRKIAHEDEYLKAIGELDPESPTYAGRGRKRLLKNVRLRPRPKE